MNKHKNKIPILAGILFILLAIFAVSSAWLSGDYLYDLKLSFSSYVGLRHSTSIMYFTGIIIMLPMLAFYLSKFRLPPAKKIVYAAAFLCILGTALFPCNRYSDSPTAALIKIHTFFATGGMLPVSALFILSAVLSRNSKQRTAAFGSLFYAGVFAVLFIAKFQPLYDTFFIWESLFIILLIVQIYMEQYGETKYADMKKSGH